MAKPPDYSYPIDSSYTKNAYLHNFTYTKNKSLEFVSPLAMWCYVYFLAKKHTCPYWHWQWMLIMSSTIFHPRAPPPRCTSKNPLLAPWLAHPKSCDLSLSSSPCHTHQCPEAPQPDDGPEKPWRGPVPALEGGCERQAGRPPLHRATICAGSLHVAEQSFKNCGWVKSRNQLNAMWS